MDTGVPQTAKDRSADLVARLNASVGATSKVESRIASYLLANLSGLPFETGASLAEKIGVSGASISRFCRSIGYADIKDLKSALQAGPAEPAWLLGDKLRDFHRRSLVGNTELSRALELEIAAVTAVYELATTPAFERAVRRLARCPAVHIAGFQVERGQGQQLAHNLQYLRAGVHLADISGGHFAEVLLGDPAKTCLVLIDGRRYSSMAFDLAEAARSRGIPVTLITDPYCTWAKGKVSELFAVQTDLNHFWDTTSAFSSLVGLLTNGVFKELGAEVEARMFKVSELYNTFVGHVGEPHHPNR
jgi:DNA-binding MurR/RpiR family transcriptional regulator